MPSDYSRALLLGQHATGRDASELERTLAAGTVTISVDPSLPEALLTARVLLTTLRRGPGQLVLERGSIPSRSVEEMAGAVAAVDPEKPLVVAKSWGESSIRLHVGADHAHAIRVVPEGYGAHVVVNPKLGVRPTRAANALGAIYAAALGAAEAFKWTADVLPARHVTHHHLRFCPVTLSGDLTAAPDLLAPPILDLTQVGVGAIGTGTILLLQAMRAQGRLTAVDRQRFAPENLGTYSLGGAVEAAAAPWKADMAREALPLFDVTPFHRSVTELPSAVDSGEVPWSPLVFTALDTAEARRDAQRLWPDRLIDAGTGDTMLGIHDLKHDSGPCLICLFTNDRSAPSAAEMLSEATGLPRARAMQGDAALSAEDLAQLTPDQQRLLTPHLGKPVCGLAKAIGLTGLNADGYQPSIPFVSLQAACLAVGRLISGQLDLTSPGNLVQYDSLIGPQATITDTMRRRPDCVCSTRATTIEQVRHRRRTESLRL